MIASETAAIGERGIRLPDRGDVGLGGRVSIRTGTRGLSSGPSPRKRSARSSGCYGHTPTRWLVALALLPRASPRVGHEIQYLQSVSALHESCEPTYRTRNRRSG